ncbi:MAG: peptide deformylase, partial [Candidatus Saccharimonadales bacterium]
MTKDHIITLPNPNLRQRSRKVADINDQVKSVIEGMKAATLDWEAARAHEVGVALAAVQINELLKIVVIRANPDDKNSRAFNVFINPEITKYEGEIVNDYEGCLSIVDIYGMVPRHSKVRVKAINEAGQEFRLKAEGFLARILQHE